MGIAGVFSVDNLCSWALASDINLVTILYNVCYFDQPDLHESHKLVLVLQIQEVRDVWEANFFAMILM